MKICSKCKIEKKLEEYYKCSRNKTGYEGKCKICKNQYTNINNEKLGKEYFRKIVLKSYYKNHEKNKEKNKNNWELNKGYWLNNEFRKEYMKNYVKINRKKLTEHNKNRYKNDIQFKLGIVLRQRFKSAIKGYKIHEIENLISCSIEYCRLHLEQQFLPEMNWENHGSIWEIDHKIPCSKYDLTNIEHQKQCFHYTNIQPLFKTTEIAESFGYTNQIGNRNKSNKTK